MMYGDDGGGWAWMAVMMQLMWLLLIGLTVWLVARLMHGSGGNTPHGRVARDDRESPEEILDRRFASGEIDAETHAVARRQLRDHAKS